MGDRRRLVRASLGFSVVSFYRYAPGIRDTPEQARAERGDELRVARERSGVIPHRGTDAIL